MKGLGKPPLGSRDAVSAPQLHLVHHDLEAELQVTGDWIACETGVRSAVEVRRLVSDVAAARLRIDAARLGKWDSALIVFLKMLRDEARSVQPLGIRVDESDLPRTARRLLDLATAVGQSQVAALEMPRISVVARVGAASLRVGTELSRITILIGQTALSSLAALARRASTRSVDLLQQAREAGASALVIVAIVNSLVGAVMAFVGAVELRRFGAGIYVADLVGIGLVREMAPIMTAIVMAGRTGGAYAAHLAAMEGNEETDALKAFGIPIIDFLVLPRVAALVTMLPLLYLYACAFGLLGGYLVSLATLDITGTAFLQELRGAVGAKQFAIGLSKSISFGALIALAGCYIGMRAGRSAAAVGHAATSAVVAGIVGVIALDALFAVCTNALGI